MEWALAGSPVSAERPASRPTRPTISDTGASAPAHADGESAARFEQRLKEEVERARRTGIQEGLAAGKKEALAELDGLMRQLAHSIETLAGLKPRLRQEAERDVVKLSLAVARRVLRREIQIDHEAVLGLVKAALENTSAREVTEVRVHPSHAARIREHLSSIGGPEAIQVRADSALELGAVLVETQRGVVDASLETQLDEISRGFADLLPGGRAS